MVSRGNGPWKDVASDDDVVYFRVTDLLEHRLKRGEVRMNVVDGSDAHYGIPLGSRRKAREWEEYCRFLGPKSPRNNKKIKGFETGRLKQSVSHEFFSSLLLVTYLTSLPIAMIQRCCFLPIHKNAAKDISGHSCASGSEPEGQDCCKQIHWPVHDDHPRETARPQIDELKDHDQWQKLQEAKDD